MSANRKGPDGTPRFAASHLGLFCLPMSHKKDAMCIKTRSATFPVNKYCMLLCQLKGWPVEVHVITLCSKCFSGVVSAIHS